MTNSLWRQGYDDDDDGDDDDDDDDDDGDNVSADLSVHQSSPLS